jgi:hypothetical protein
MRRWLKRGLILVVLFVLAPVGFYFYASWQGERELRAVLDQLDAEEAPWRWEDLDAARQPVPKDQEVRGLIVKLTTQMPRSFAINIMNKTKDRHHPQVLLSAEDYEIYQEELQAAEQTLAEARTIAGMPNGRLHIEAPKDVRVWNWNLDDVQKARQLAHLLQVSALRHAHQGDLERAMQECLAMQRTAQALQDEHLLIAQLVRMAIQAIALWSLEITLGHGQPAPADLERLQRAWEQFDTALALKNGFLGERAFCHRMFEALAAGKIAVHELIGPRGTQLPIWERASHLYLHSNLKQAHAWSLKHWTSALKALDLPDAESFARLEELNQEAHKAPGVARLHVPAFNKIAEAHRRTEARTRAAITALAAERFRRDQGRWPRTMEELCPKYLGKVLGDPYSGTPLGWRATGDGVVVYSIGPDGKQRGAYQEEVGKGVGVISYEFRLWDVPKRRQIDIRQP